MDKIVGIPLNTNNWLIFSVWNDSAQPYTDGTNEEFTIDVLRDGEVLDPHGLTVYHINNGRYHITNSGDSSIPYISTSEEQMYIRVWHDTYGSYTLFEFWAGTQLPTAYSGSGSATTSDVESLKPLIFALY